MILVQVTLIPAPVDGFVKRGQGVGQFFHLRRNIVKKNIIFFRIRGSQEEVSCTLFGGSLPLVFMKNPRRVRWTLIPRTLLGLHCTQGLGSFSLPVLV